MADQLAPAAPTTPAGPSPRRRRLDARTVGICVCIALIGAIAAYFVAAAVQYDGNNASGEGSAQIPLSSGRIDGTKLLATTIVTTGGKHTTLLAVMGAKPVLVNLWQQSCEPCVKEMPLLDVLHRQDHRVDVIGVDFQDQLAAAKSMAAKTGITYPWFRDPTGDFGVTAQIVGLPRTILIDRSGRVLAEKTGQFDSLAQARSWLDHNLR